MTLVVSAFFVVTLVWPVGYMLKEAFFQDGRFSLAAFGLVLGNQVLTESIWNSFAVASFVTFFATLISFPVAHVFVHYEFRGKVLLQGVFLSALVLPPFVASIGVRQLFARCGSINLLLMDLGITDQPIDFLGANPLVGVVLMETLHLYPILFLNLVAALSSIDPSLDEAAESVGASRVRRFLRVTLPMALPGYFAGAIIVFVFAFTDLGTPIVFDAGDLVPMQIFDKATKGARDPVGFALVVVVLLLSLVLFLLGRRAVASRSGQQASKGAVVARTRRISGFAKPLVALGLFALAAVTLLPHLAVAAVAFADRWFFSIVPEGWTLRYMEQVARTDVASTGVRNSLLYASCSTLIDLVLGVTIAWMSVRVRSRFSAVADACAMLPLALPGIVLAFGYAGLYSQMFDPFLIIVFGYATRRLPYVVRSADAGFRQVPVHLEEAAKSLGASGPTTLRRVTMPLLMGHLIAGGILAFSFAMLEVSESLILAPRAADYPIAKAIWQLLGDVSDGPQIACAMGVIGSVLLLYSLIAASRVLGRSLGELFRA